MIVTRQRKKPFPWKRVLAPLLLLAALVAALCFAPSRRLIATAPVVAPLAQPFDAIAQQRRIKGQGLQIAALEHELADARLQLDDRNKRISQLHRQLNDAAGRPAAMSGEMKPAMRATLAPAPDLSAQGTPDMRRTAQVWGAMDPEPASKVVERLPLEYVARIFALMPPDAVGAILENLPASYAARLTQEHPELGR